jgi:hypothetical protein
MTDEERALLQDFGREIEAQDVPIHLELTAMQVVVLVGAIQLACRHPHFSGPSAMEVESIARQLQEMIGQVCGPATRAVLEKGWFGNNESAA